MKASQSSRNTDTQTHEFNYHKRSPFGNRRRSLQFSALLEIIIDVGSMENIEQWAVDFQQRDWVWRREGLQNITCGINLYWKDNMTVIREVIQMIVGGPDLFDEFRRGSCFGHLVDFVGGNSCNNAINALLSREVIIDGAGEHDTWFQVGGTNIRFFPTEFALVSGLQFGGSDFDTSPSYDFHGSSFYARQLNKTPLKVKDLLELFRTFSLGVDPDDYIMVVGVLFVHTMIFGYDQMPLMEQFRQTDGVSCGILAAMQVDRLISKKWRYGFDISRLDILRYRKVLGIRIFEKCDVMD